MCLAIPARVIDQTIDDSACVLVDVAGVRRHINAALLSDDPPRTGDWVLVHVGFALSRISEEQALDQLRILSMLGEQDAAAQEASGYGVIEDRPGDKEFL